MENFSSVVKFEVDNCNLNVKKEIIDSDELLVHDLDCGVQSSGQETRHHQNEACFTENICQIVKKECQYEMVKEILDENKNENNQYNDEKKKFIKRSSDKGGKTCPKQSELQTHQVTHKGDKKHACDVCGKIFLHSSRLKIHHLSHTGEKKHRCVVCQKTFILPHHLKRHQLVHTRVRNYTCGVCSKSFKLFK